MNDDTTAAIVEVRNLPCACDGTVILEGVSFAGHLCELLFVIGGSGCGKTTRLGNRTRQLSSFQSAGFSK
jgi:phospholipid/cholesterol/gamma-HCH transport system ATP-binding protein